MLEPCLVARNEKKAPQFKQTNLRGYKYSMTDFNDDDEGIEYDEKLSYAMLREVMSNSYTSDIAALLHWKMPKKYRKSQWYGMVEG